MFALHYLLAALSSPLTFQALSGSAEALSFQLLSSRGWTNCLIHTKISSTITEVTATKVKVDITFNFGVLSQRTNKQAGKPGTQP